MRSLENEVMRRLPPFPELVAFEAVARHLSFTRAAAELCVTQSAVSHRVRRLEQHFGVQLIQRLNPGLKLTDAGAALLPELTATLDTLSHLGVRRERRLRVTAGSALCTWWLAGRLSKFMAQRPGIAVELVPVENGGASMPEADVRILWVAPEDAEQSPVQMPLFSEEVFPVCSPRLLPDGLPSRDPHVLAAMPLLHKASQAPGEWSWQTWFDRLGIGLAPRRSDELRFADMGLMLSAAIGGSGVGLARSLLAYDPIKGGRLVVPVAGIEPMISAKRHVARWQRAGIGDPDIGAFVKWLAADAAKTIAATRKRIDALHDAGDSSAELEPAHV
jgi:LysR family glycine cleavage system transcriptional activator